MYLLKLFLYDGLRDPLKLFLSLKQQYGDMVKITAPDLGGKAILLSDPKVMREVLIEKQNDFKKPKTPTTRDVKQIMGNGLVTSHGEGWRRQHRILMPHFQNKSVQKMVPVAIEEADRLINRWRNQFSKKNFNLLREMKDVTLRFITRALFDHDLSSEELTKIRQNIDILRSAYRKIRTSLISFPFWIPTPNNIRAKQAQKSLFLLQTA